MKYHVNFDITLRKNHYQGKYIVVEGIDGSGKTTQVERITKALWGKGITVVQTREPRKEGIIGELVQKILTRQIKIPSSALQYLFTTDRVINQEEVVIPALKSGNTVVSDRCFWSAVVYGILDRTGGVYNKTNADFILIAQSILSMYHQFIVPDYTFYLKVSLEKALAGIAKKDDVKEIYEDRKKLRKVIEGYDWLAEKFAKEIITVDGEKRIEEVTKEIVDKISNLKF